MDHPMPRILIADDQKSIRRTMTVIIETRGCQVVDVEDGYQAIESVRNNDFDLVFLDIKMPGINGVQTFREIKKLKPDSLVVVMTGCRVQELIDAAVDEGVMSVVLKPFEPKQIIQLVQAAHGLCPERLPSDIGALAGQIQQQIDGVVGDSPLARLTVRVPDNDLKALRTLAVSGPVSESTQPLASFTSMGGAAFYKNEVQIVNDEEINPLICESDIGLGIKSAVAVPIRTSSERVLGSVSASCYEHDYFGPGVIDKFWGLAREVGDLMESTSLAEAGFLHGLNRVRIPAA